MLLCCFCFFAAIPPAPTVVLPSPFSPLPLSSTSPTAYANLVTNNSNTIWNGQNVTVGAASMTSLSFLRLYYDVTSKRIYPFLTAIINVDKGVISGITWDNACVFCSPNECQDITYDFNGNLQTQESSGQPTQGCYVDETECATNPQACDLMLYVVWSGTDATNRALQSSNSRFSAFPPQNLQDRIKSILPSFPTLRRKLQWGGQQREEGEEEGVATVVAAGPEF